MDLVTLLGTKVSKIAAAQGIEASNITWVETITAGTAGTAGSQWNVLGI